MVRIRTRQRVFSTLHRFWNGPLLYTTPWGNTDGYGEPSPMPTQEASGEGGISLREISALHYQNYFVVVRYTLRPPQSSMCSIPHS